MTALAGALYCQYQMFISPDTVSGIAVSLQMVFAVVVGGIYVALGPTVGAIITILLAEGLRIGFGTKAVGWDNLIYGVLLVLFIIFLPKGILGSILARVQLGARGAPTFHLDPDLVLVLFLPPLLMDGAWVTDIARFRRHLAGILSLAIGAVIFTTLVVAAVTHWLMPSLPWAACAALGAIVSPPDAVSARAVLQRIKLPRRLSTLLEGESLLNDAAGLVLFRFAVAAAMGGAFDPGVALGHFAWLAVGGIIVGLVVGRLWVAISHRLHDELTLILSLTLVCWLTYLAGEAIHVSGVIATVTVGLVLGWHQHVVLTAAARLRGSSFWSVLVFVLEALVFMLIGLSLREIIEHAGGFGIVFEQLAWPLIAIVLGLTAARFAWVFGSNFLLRIASRAKLTRHEAARSRRRDRHELGRHARCRHARSGVVVARADAGRDFMLPPALARREEHNLRRPAQPLQALQRRHASGAARPRTLSVGSFSVLRPAGSGAWASRSSDTSTSWPSSLAASSRRAATFSVSPT